ncbi:symmetrical bis(5'-nucleosyl)-tetraphosphatase [Viridibacterium curvum]|uniref:Bis(5'-nucleosyl)-tetraphosphatase, symmetrical n=1 Tax=Viridibacterium curvum TaxID=1101404 RepID=A0ABP9QL00_9RHOO
MSTYVVGDLQGCFDPLLKLLETAGFDARHDRLWLVGDLVNRGAQSAEVLRFVRDLGGAATAVLGNHDLYMLAVAAGVPAKARESDTINGVLTAPDAEALIDWLRHLPLMHVEGQSVLVHAGLLPEWSVAQARELAAEVEAALRGDAWREYLQHLFGNQPSRWDGELRGWDRHRIVINAMTRMRFLTADGAIDLKPKGAPELAESGLMPWYAAPDAAWRSHTLYVGHWSALGVRDMGHVVALDSGCVWGGQLTAFRVEDRATFQVSCEACGIRKTKGED